MPFMSGLTSELLRNIHAAELAGKDKAEAFYRRQLVTVAAELRSGQLEELPPLDPELAVQTEQPNLSRLRTLQANRLIHLGFHDALDMTATEYRRSIPAMQPAPPEYRLRFHVPLVVDPRVSIDRQRELLGLKQGGVGDIVNGESDLTVPYTVWTNMGRRVKDGGYKPDEVPSRFVELMAFYAQKPHLVSSLSSPGSGEQSRVPFPASGTIPDIDSMGFVGYTHANTDLIPKLTRGQQVNVRRRVTSTSGVE
jgi:hypothetical protein